MKKFYTLLCAVLLTVVMVAQTPQKMSYQAVIRNSSDALVVSTTIGMRISILQTTSSGTAVYVETQTPTTNANGLVSIEIGGGTVVSGTFSAIDWSAGPYFIKTEIAVVAPLTTYTITGTSQLLSIPYALYARTAASYTETDPIYSAWDKSTGISITASQVSDFESGVTNTPAVLANTAKISYPAPDAAKLAAITGTNTGDETAATIKTKLGITTLSGSNTGDNAVNTLYSGLVSNADHTGDASGSTVLTLATVNSNLGTFNNITINAKGLATAGTNVSYLTSETDPIVKAINGIVKSSGTTISAATAGTDYLTPTGSAAGLTGFPTLNQNTTGSAASFTGSLGGDVTGTQSATVIANKVTMTGTLPISVSGSPTVIASAPVAITIAPATTTTPGYMSAPDKVKLDGLATTGHYLGESYLGGVIFNLYIEGGAQHGLVVALTETGAATTPWDGSASPVATTGTSFWDGATNTSLMTASTAIQTYLSGLPVTTGTWYVPSVDELLLLRANLYYANKGISAAGGTQIGFNDYWSSTESDATMGTSCYFKDGVAYTGAKSGFGDIRAIKAF